MIGPAGVHLLAGAIAIGVVCAGVGAAGGAAVVTEALGRPVAAGTPVTVRAGADGAAELVLEPGSSLLAPLGGTLVSQPGRLVVSGSPDAADGDVAVSLAGVDASVSGGAVARGQVLGTSHGTQVRLAVTVDGATVDAAPLIRDALDPDSAGPAARPVLGSTISQGFGCTSYSFEPLDPFCPGGHVHTGVDLAAPRGTPVQATLGGRVTVIRSRGGYGLHVLIAHDGGLLSLYGHLDSVRVASGDVVAPGGLIGTVGSTGNSTGPHLHFEVRRDGRPEDPRLLVPLP